MTQKIYIGPSIPGVIEQNRILREILPEKVQERAREDKAFERLLVSPDELIAARSQLDEKGSVLAVSFLKVLCSLNG